VPVSKTKRARKKRAKERNRLVAEEAARGYAHNLATAHLRPTNLRRLRGIGSRGLDLKIHFQEEVEIPYDREDPLKSVLRARELGDKWDQDTTAGDA